MRGELSCNPARSDRSDGVRVSVVSRQGSGASDRLVPPVWCVGVPSGEGPSSQPLILLVVSGPTWPHMPVVRVTRAGEAGSRPLCGRDPQSGFHRRWKIGQSLPMSRGTSR